jgi:truncated hemoglobin YjbI
MAAAETIDNPALREAILQPVRRLADHMQNKQP